MLETDRNSNPTIKTDHLAQNQIIKNIKPKESETLNKLACAKTIAFTKRGDRKWKIYKLA